MLSRSVLICVSRGLHLSSYRHSSPIRQCVVFHGTILRIQAPGPHLPFTQRVHHVAAHEGVRNFLRESMEKGRREAIRDSDQFPHSPSNAEHCGKFGAVVEYNQSVLPAEFTQPPDRQYQIRGEFINQQCPMAALVCA